MQGVRGWEVGWGGVRRSDLLLARTPGWVAGADVWEVWGVQELLSGGGLGASWRGVPWAVGGAALRFRGMSRLEVWF